MEIHDLDLQVQDFQNFAVSPMATNYDLDLEERDFQFPQVEFPEFAIKTLQSYEDCNRRINSFRLWMQTSSHHPLARKLIINAIKLGATDLTLRIPVIVRGEKLCVLPNQVLDSETLARLNATECQIDLGLGKNEVRCSNLKSLSLSHVSITGDLYCDLISKCASIEEITLDTTRSLRKHGEQRRLIPSRDTYSMIQLHKLKSLHLIGLDSRDNIYRHNLWPKFPGLKELMIWDHNSDYNWKGLRICSRSLELIALYMYASKITNGKFEVPNIRKFKVVGVHLPRLDEFKTSSGNREWESDIQIEYSQLNVSWFSSLSKLLRTLSSSRISLSVCMHYSFIDQYTVYFGDGFPIPIVEDLKISGHHQQRFSTFIDALLHSCRPNRVSIDTRFIEEANLDAPFQVLGYRPCERHDLSNDQQYLAKFQLI